MFPDPISHAIRDYLNGQRNQDIVVHCDLAEDDIMEVDYFFRTYAELPEREKVALSHCGKKVLDIGACAGAHAFPLIEKGHDVTAIDTAQGSIEYLISKGIAAEHVSFLNYSGAEYDTLLFLMNGIGIAGKLEQLDHFLQHCSTLLRPGGSVLCDSTDVRYFYEDEEGAVWMDLNAEYYGEFSFQLVYKETEGEWFNWLYLDYATLEKHALKNGFSCTILQQDDAEFLAKLVKL